MKNEEFMGVAQCQTWPKFGVIVLCSPLAMKQTGVRVHADLYHRPPKPTHAPMQVSRASRKKEKTSF